MCRLTRRQGPPAPNLQEGLAQGSVALTHYAPICCVADAPPLRQLFRRAGNWRTTLGTVLAPVSPASSGCRTRFAQDVAEFARIPLSASRERGGILANSATPTARISMNNRKPCRAPAT